MTFMLQVKEQPQTRKSGATKRNGKKRNRKKKGARKQCELQTDETVSNCDNDTVYEAPPVGEWQQCNRDVLETDAGSAELSEVDAGYEKYWAEQGEYLVWEGWIGKYPDYLSQVGVNDGIPAVREVEICSEDIGDIGEPSTECHQSECVDRTDNIIKEMESGDMTDVPPQDNCDGTMKNASFGKLKCPTVAFNNVVTSRMARVTEVDTVDNSDVSSGESNAWLVHEMHDYALSRVGDEPQTDSGDTCQHELETTDGICRTVSETSGDIWEALWTEHYAETYWYYYNQYRQWFGGSDQLITDIQQLPVYTTHLLPSGEESKQHTDNEDADAADDESLLHAISSKCSITNDDCCDQTENSGLQHHQNCHVMSKRTDDEVEETPASMETDRCCDAEAGVKEGSREEGEQSDGSGQKRRRKQKSQRSDGSGRFVCYPCTEF